MLGALNTSLESLQQELKKEHATYIRIEAPERHFPTPNAETLREWADDAFKGLGGSRMIFGMLGDPEDRSQLVLKVRRMAERRIALTEVQDGATEASDPLIDALEQMAPSERQRRFKELLARSMPWIDGNLSRDIQLNSDQFKCFIGVANSKEFERRFRAEIETAVPTHASITASQVAIVDTGTPGKAVCYCELSGIPLTVMRGLDAWRTSYRKESENIPVHTHVDSTQFTHPIVPTMEELNFLADDFKNYLLAVMLGVLTRSAQKVTPPGQYQFMVRRGENLRMGNERAFRQNGLPRMYREQILAAVHAKLEQFDLAQITALSALASYYETEVYSPRLVPNETGLETPRKGFASAMAGELYRELREKAMRRSMSEQHFEVTEALALERKTLWAAAVEGSEKDAYEWEVRDPEGSGQARMKYVVRTEFSDAAWLARILSTSTDGLIKPIETLPLTTLPPPLPGAPPVTYMVAINGQQAGPYSALHISQFLANGQLTPAALVWRAGMSTWLPLAQLPELAGMSAAPPLPGVPPLPGG
jgi:hypothetical protein